MTRVHLPAILAVVAIGMLVSAPALAGHDEPAKANKFQASLVNGFAECFSPNTDTQAPNSASACAPPVRPFLSSGCAFSPGGSGKFSMKVTGNVESGKEDIKVSAVAQGLNANCEGLNLCASVALRTTTDDCPEGSCTTVDLENFKLPGPEGCCIVTDGKCKINTSLLITEVLTRGKNSGTEVHGCGLAPDPPGGAQPVVTCGILFK